jgi:hypothetical protein
MKEDRGMEWFYNEVCKNCESYLTKNSCPQDIKTCIDAEMLREFQLVTKWMPVG